MKMKLMFLFAIPTSISDWVKKGKNIAKRLLKTFPRRESDIPFGIFEDIYYIFFSLFGCL